jgi:hypothetical protein
LGLLTGAVIIKQDAVPGMKLLLRRTPPVTVAANAVNAPLPSRFPEDLKPLLLVSSLGLFNALVLFLSFFLLLDLKK